MDVGTDFSDDRFKVPPPESCGYHADLRGLILTVTIRGSFDRENKGRSWAGQIVEAFDMPLERVDIDFVHCTIVSSTVFAGLIQLFTGFKSRCQNGIHLVKVGRQVKRSLQMLKIADFFTIHEAADK